jgi:hypothetical protein
MCYCSKYFLVLQVSFRAVKKLRFFLNFSFLGYIGFLGFISFLKLFAKQFYLRNRKAK